MQLFSFSFINLRPLFVRYPLGFNSLLLPARFIGAVGFGDAADNYYQLAVVSCRRDLCFYGMLLCCSAYPSYLLWFIIFA